MQNQTLDFLSNALKFGINPGLERINGLCELLGHPERDFKVIHVAGTNGKGSTCAYMLSMLADSGLKTGLFTSPYLERFSERIRIIDGRESLLRYVEDDSEGEIPEDALTRITLRVKEACAKLVSEGVEHPTEFELVTAICFVYFSEEKIDVAVMETGLGGRLDSTNVFPDPVATVITAIGMDHMEVLGDTISKITSEKTGILKTGSPAFIIDPDYMMISPDQQAEVRTTIDRDAAAKNVVPTYVKPAMESVRYTDDFRMTFDINALGSNVESYLLGDHQCANCTLAAEAVLSASKIWPQITADTIKEGICLTRWKCRAEVLSTDPLIILDGGHNPQGAQSFAAIYGRFAKQGFITKPARLVIGVMRDKDIKGIVEEYLKGGIDIGEIWPVEVNNPRTAKPDDLYNIFKEVYNKPIDRGEATVPEEAVKRARLKSCEDKMPLVITGSLYLLGQVRGVLTRE